MKRTYLPALILFLLICQVFKTNAQNWQPINKNYTYNYLLDNKQLPVYSIKVDSVTINTTGDSVYFLNKVFTKCTTCKGNRIRVDAEEYYYFGKFYINQNQFLLNEMIFSGNGNFSFFSPATQVKIELMANNTSPWQFDFTNNINADVIRAKDTLIFGSSDSVKHILLSSGDIVLLSKNNGILQFPSTYGSKKYYTLAGINEKKAGITIPGVKEIYDFEVGDKFEYHDSIINSPIKELIIRQYTITSKTRVADSITYGYEGNIREKGKGRTYSGIMKYSISTSQLLNKNYHELYQIKPHDEFEFKNYPIYDTIGINYNNTFNTYTKIIDTDFSRNYLLKPYTDSNFAVNLMVATDDIYNYEEYVPGVGIIKFKEIGMSSAKISKLVAHKNNKRTIGTFTPVSEILSVNETRINFNNWKIYPNPANSIIYLSNSANDDVHNFSYKLCDLQGKEILSLIEKGQKASINIEHLAKGIYILKILDKDQLYIQKIIKN